MIRRQNICSGKDFLVLGDAFFRDVVWMFTLEIDLMSRFNSISRPGENERRFDGLPGLCRERILYNKGLIGYQMLARGEGRSNDPHFEGFTRCEYLEQPFPQLDVDPLRALVGGRLFGKQFA